MKKLSSALKKQKVFKNAKLKIKQTIKRGARTMKSADVLKKISTDEQIRETLKIGQLIITNQVPWGQGQGRSYEYRQRVGKVVAKYPHYFVVQFPHYKECFKYSDVLVNVVQLYNETEEDKDIFSWLKNLKE